MQQGATYRKVIRYLDAAGEPKKLATWTAHSQIKTGYGAPGSLLDLSTRTGEITLTDDGEIIILLSKLQTRALPVVYKTNGPSVASYFYDLFLNDPSTDFSQRFLVGTVLVNGALTDAD
jgi:hypothetical protein